MPLHLIADDLEGHAWYEQLFVRTIADAEAHAARWAAFEEAVIMLVAEAAESPAPEPW
jgi:hypothetical protein